MIQILPARGRAFAAFPYTLHRTDPHWIPPLRFTERARFDRRHPFYAHADVELFLAWDDGRIAGRVAAIDDRLHNETHRDNLAAFGYFEARSAEASHALLAAAEAWARARGRSKIRGPLNPSLNDSAGLLVNGFDADPMILMPYNPPEYASFIESAGYHKVKDLLAWTVDLPGNAHSDRARRLFEWFRTRHRLTIRPVSLAAFDRELEQFLDIYCRAWQRNWGFVAPTPAESRHFATELRPIVDPELVLAAEIDGQLVGCAVAVPDLNQVLKGTNGRFFPKGFFRILTRKRIITQARFLLLGVLPEYRRIGLGPLLATELARRAERRYRRIELSWVLEDNEDTNQGAAALGAKQDKTYRLYEKAL